MIIDSSAIIAIVFKEPGYESLLDKLAGAAHLAIGTPTLVEAGIVLSSRLERDSRPILRTLLSTGAIDLVPFSESHSYEAIEAFLRFGKGRHPAQLNYGDCMAYAVAKLAAEPLLFVGNDFLLTDIVAA